jgi:hypothetical protein
MGRAAATLAAATLLLLAPPPAAALRAYGHAFSRPADFSDSQVDVKRFSQVDVYKVIQTPLSIYFYGLYD